MLIDIAMCISDIRPQSLFRSVTMASTTIYTYVDSNIDQNLVSLLEESP